MADTSKPSPAPESKTLASVAAIMASMGVTRAHDDCAAMLMEFLFGTAAVGPWCAAFHVV